jgi:hypothetical protein
MICPYCSRAIAKNCWKRTRPEKEVKDGVSKRNWGRMDSLPRFRPAILHGVDQGRQARRIRRASAGVGPRRDATGTDAGELGAADAGETQDRAIGEVTGSPPSNTKGGTMGTVFRKDDAMNRKLLPLLACGLLVQTAFCGCTTEQDKAVAEIKRLGGKVEFDKTSPGKPVVLVNLARSEVPDAGLVHLKELTRLRHLDLTDTRVTNAGLEHLKGLSQLQSLCLSSTQVTDAGLEHLKGLTQLQMLDLTHNRIAGAGLVHLMRLTRLETLTLGYTNVTDAGLEHLKSMTQLQTLGLRRTGVTQAGVTDLQKALPRTSIVSD